MASPSFLRNNWLLNTAGLLYRAFKGYYFDVVVILLLALVGSFFEGVGISAIIPIYSFVGGGGGAATDVVSNVIREFFLFFGFTYTFRTLLIFIGILFMLRAFAMFFIQLITARILYGYERDMRRLLFSYTVQANWPYLSRQKLGNLSQLLMVNTSNSAQFFNYFSATAIIATRILVYVAIAVNVSPLIALMSVVAGILVFFVLKPIFSKNRALSAQREKGSRGVSHFVNQHITGMKTVKAMAVERPVIKASSEYFEKIRAAGVAVLTIRGFIQMVTAFAGLGFVALTFAIMYKSPSFQLATFAVIVYAVNQIFSQVQLAQNQLHAASESVPYLSAMLEYMDVARVQEEEVDTASRNALEIKDRLSFWQVSFSYPGRDTTLSGVSFEAPRGSVVGIIGPSGAGKTTVADLLLRLYEPSAGSITVDGKNISDVSHTAWRSHIGYVTQDMFLLNDTIERNIAFYNDSIAHNEVVAAAKLADIHEFIETLPEKYDTIVGDRGILLSGGQRQRVILARTLARKPTLLVLDEATSSLDAESERAVQETIERLHGKVTAIIIAHRLSTIQNADTLVVLKEGKVVEQGTPQALLADTNSYFHSVYSMHQS